MPGLSDSPQIGSMDVDPIALQQAGVALAVLVDALGARLDSRSAADAPSTGWRVLAERAEGPSLLGAPVDGDGRKWRLAHIQGSRPEASVTVLPNAMPLRASRASRGSGLELRWPAVMIDSSTGSDFVIDIVNSGASRWIPDGDGFLVVGALTTPGVTDFAIGWAHSGQARAVPLDPGEYARVPVSIESGVWATLESGQHDLHAVLVDLGLGPHKPLRVTLSNATIDAHRSGTARRNNSPEQRRRSIDAQIAQLRAQIIAGERFDAVIEAISTAASDDDAVSRIENLLGVDEEPARALYYAPLSELRPGRVEALERQISGLLRQRDRG